MFVIIKDQRKLTHHELIGQDVLEYAGIRIYPKNGVYYLSLKDGYSLSDGTMTIRISSAYYEIMTPDAYSRLEVYIYENGKGVNDFVFCRKRNFIMAADPRADVLVHDEHLKKHYLLYKDGILRSDFDLVVNGQRYDGNPLNNGDKVEYLGIIFYHFNDFIYINRFNCEIRLPAYDLKTSKLLYRRQLPKSYTLIPVQNDELSIREVEKYEPADKPPERDIMSTILPSLIMTLSIMIIASINLYNSIETAGFMKLQAATYIISPLAMAVSGVALPLIFYKKEKKKQQNKENVHLENYRQYLAEYEEELDEKISTYLQEQYRHFFMIDEYHPYFYLSNRDEDFMTLSLGETVLCKELEYTRSGNEQLDRTLKKLEQKLANIEGCPLMLKISDYTHLSIVAKPSKLSYYFDRFLLELAYKHHFHDLHLAVYIEDENEISRFYNMPHLFINEKRMSLTSAADLQELDQLKTDKPLILLMKKRSSFVFHNPAIHVLDFVDEREKIFKDSDCVIEYLNNLAYLYTDRKVCFYDREIHYDFRHYFYQLGKFNEFLEHDDDYSFRKLFDDFDIIQSYRQNRQGLKADFAVSGNVLLNFDLHESKQGPHGLIAGTTGSGKSELIISLLLSLCIRYAPDYLNIILIDYKGGGIRESLSYDGISLPQIIASVSNLENNTLERLIIALNNECLYRERMFRQLSALSGSPVMNLDDYLENDYEYHNMKKIAHLLIVVDEFAELKKEHPEQIRELISLSRIGRSLGLHLILATQKPAGNIDDEIFSNSRFKISLKVLEEKDSLDIIRSKDAAYLSKAGSFYLRIDESLIRAESIYAKRDFNDQEAYEVGVYDHQLSKRNSRKIMSSSGLNEANEFVRRIIEACNELQIQKQEFEFLPPPSLKRSDLNISDKLIFGIGDDYLRHRNPLVIHELSDDLLIVSYRDREIDLLLNTLNENGRRCAVIAGKYYQNANITDSLLYEQEEDIFFLYEQLLKKDHDIALVIEDLSCLLSYHEEHLDYLHKFLKRSSNLKMNMIALSRQVQLPYKLISSFADKLLIGVSDPNDVSYFFGGRIQYKGDSFFYDDQVISFVPLQTEEFIEEEKKCEALVRRIPEKIAAEKTEKGYLLGYDLKEKEKIYAQKGLLICSFDEELLEVYRKAYGDQFSYELYDLKTISKGDLLWLGPGIFGQRLFVSSLKDDLQENEGILISRGKKKLLRSLYDA